MSLGLVALLLLLPATGAQLPVAHGSIPLKRGLDAAADADDSQGTSFAQMNNFRNTQYTGTVYVGSPPQQFNVILDTGSANFWVYSKECTSAACRAHRQYDPDQSSTYSTNQTTFFVKYGSGRINGIMSQDNIQLGSLVIPQQIFGAVTRETGSAFMWGKYDGILGLAFPTLAIEGSVPVLDTIIQQGLITPMFSFFFSSGKTESAFYVGGVPSSYARHPFVWHHVIRKGYWEIGMDDMVINGVSLGACPHHTMQKNSPKVTNKLQANANTLQAFKSDSGSYPVFAENVQLDSDSRDPEEEFISELEASSESASLLETESKVWMAVAVSSTASVCLQTSSKATVGMRHTAQSRLCSQMSSAHGSIPLSKFPENDASYTHDLRCKAAVDTGTSLITGPSEYIAKLQDMMGQVTNCEDLSNMPTVTFVIDGVNYPLTPQEYVLQFDAEDGQPPSCLLGFKALDVPPPRGPLWVLGDVFLRSYFSVFDRSQNRIGLTKANVSPAEPTDPSPYTPDLEQLPIGIDTDRDLSTPTPPQSAPASDVFTTQVASLPMQNYSQNQPRQASEAPTVTTTNVEVVVDEPIRPPAPKAEWQQPTQNLLDQSRSDEDDYWQNY